MSDASNPTVFGLEIKPLSPDSVPLEAVVVVKALDADGETELSVRHTAGLSQWDRAGLLHAAQVVTDMQIRQAFVEGDDDDED